MNLAGNLLGDKCGGRIRTEPDGGCNKHESKRWPPLFVQKGK